jgi:hypothetical protein
VLASVAHESGTSGGSPLEVELRDTTVPWAQHGFSEPRWSYSEREMKGQERAAAGGSPHFCQLVDSRPRRSEEVMAGAPNQYGC